MQLVRSKSLSPRFIVTPQTGSTNTDLVALAASERLEEFTVLVTGSQTAGRGRLGRVWVAPAGKSLAISVLLTPVTPDGSPLGLEHFGWLPLLAGVAMTKSVAAILPGKSVTLKWPNDVLIGGKKVSGLLGELLPGATSLVMGAGVNTALAADELPTETSTSLRIEGATEIATEDAAEDGLADAVLAGYLEKLRHLYTEFLRNGADVLKSELNVLCSTLGQEVRVNLPGDDDLVGIATGIDGSGRLLVMRGSDGVIVAVAAGDVTHLRYE
jgi:BirA family biotin operon repressor/biotin-[acetyl-CoA-carboxylase] ligase